MDAPLITTSFQYSVCSGMTQVHFHFLSVLYIYMANIGVSVTLVVVFPEFFTTNINIIIGEVIAVVWPW